MEFEADSRLREMSFGKWDGRAWDEIAVTDGDRLAAWGEDWMNVSPPNGESARDVAQRARPALDELVGAAASPLGDVVAVTHAGWIRVAATLLLREPLTQAFNRSIDYARGAIFMIGDRGAALASWNVADLL